MGMNHRETNLVIMPVTRKMWQTMAVFARRCIIRQTSAVRIAFLVSVRLFLTAILYINEKPDR